LIVLSSLYFIFICPWISVEISEIIPIVQGVLLFFVINNFLLATFTDPGRYNRAPPDETDNSETSFHKIGLLFLFK
jgi:palmitoyltransferase